MRTDRTIGLKFSSLSLALVLAAMLVFAASAQAQTPADDQYGSPTDTSATDPSVTDPSASGSAEGDASASGGTDSGAAGDAASGGDPSGDPSGGGSASASAGGSASGSAGSSSGGSSSDEGENVLGDALPSTGGAPIYLALAGLILVGTGLTLRLRAASR